MSSQLPNIISIPTTLASNLISSKVDFPTLKLITVKPLTLTEGCISLLTLLCSCYTLEECYYTQNS